MDKLAIISIEGVEGRFIHSRDLAKIKNINFETINKRIARDKIYKSVKLNAGNYVLVDENLNPIPTREIREKKLSTRKEPNPKSSIKE